MLLLYSCTLFQILLVSYYSKLALIGWFYRGRFQRVEVLFVRICGWPLLGYL